MTYEELLRLLEPYPALRHACAANEVDSAKAVDDYRDLYNFPIIRTRDLRDELIQLLKAYTGER